jgi:hypothetical protein
MQKKEEKKHPKNNLFKGYTMPSRPIDIPQKHKRYLIKKVPHGNKVQIDKDKVLTKKKVKKETEIFETSTKKKK